MEHTNTLREDVNIFFRSIVGKRIWSVIAGSGTGSMMTISIGEKIKRPHQLKNLKLTTDQRDYEGEFTIFVQEARWYIKESGRVICNYENSNKPRGQMLDGVAMIEGRIVESTNHDSYNFTINFDSNLTLEVTCKLSSKQDFDNYSLYSDTGIITVGSDGNLKQEYK